MCALFSYLGFPGRLPAAFQLRVWLSFEELWDMKSGMFLFCDFLYIGLPAMFTPLDHPNLPDRARTPA